MTKRMRLVVSALFIIVVILAVAMTRAFSASSKSSGGAKTKTDISKILDDDGDGNRIFENGSGLFGVIDQNDRIIVPAEWPELSFAGNGLCIASKRIDGKLLTGCVDYEGNVVVPLVYRNIAKRSYGSFVFYAAESAADGSRVIYDETFQLAFPRAWDGCEIKDDKMTLSRGSDSYVYALGENGFSLERSKTSGSALDCGFTFEITSRKLLERLAPDMIEAMTSAAGKYIEFAFTGSGEALSGVRSESGASFRTLFPDEKRILSKTPVEITGISIHSVLSDDEVPHYEATMLVGSKLVYADSEGKTRETTNKYKAAVEFRGSSKNDLAAVSGSFLVDKPDLPEPEKKEEDPTAAAEAQEGSTQPTAPPDDKKVNERPEV